MTYITDTLYWISTGLLVPVVILLIFFFLRALLLIGSFFGQYVAMRRTSTRINNELEDLNKENVLSLVEKLPKKNQSLIVTYMLRLLKAEDNAPLRQRIVSDFEMEAEKDLSTSKTLSKMGPMLGLMGTLIPMGPALVGLSTGDIASMAYNMQVAFATTVIGLFAAGIGYITQSVKHRWYLQDLTNLEFVAELLNENKKISYETSIVK